MTAKLTVPIRDLAMKTFAVPTVLNRALAPIGDCLTSGATRQLLKLKLDKKSQARLDLLAEKCTEGELTIEERDEYESSVLTLELVTLLQAEARVTLATSEA